MPEWEVRRWVSCVLLVFVTSAAKGLAWTKPHTRDILPHNTPSTRPNPPTVDVHAGVDARAHVYDLATRAWALPLILEEGRFPSPEAKRRLEELIKRMRSEAPEDRPSLREALRALDDAEPAPAAADRAVHRKQRKRAGGVLALLKSVDPGKKRV